MRVIRVFPRRTTWTPRDPLAFVGDPPLFRPEADEVHVSVTFAWDIPEAHRLAEAWAQYYPVVRIGGPAIDGEGDAFTPGQYVRPGMTFTSRGCPNHCPWCLVRGELRLLPITPGHVIQDNNFLACPPEHRRAVYEMLAEQPQAAVFAGGLEARRITDAIAAELQQVRIREVFLAADSRAALPHLEQAVRRLGFLSRRQLRCYVLIGFNGETLDEASERLEAVWRIGCLPFAQLYQGPDRYMDYSSEWRQLAREWSRPAAMFAVHAAACGQAEVAR